MALSVVRTTSTGANTSGSGVIPRQGPRSVVPANAQGNLLVCVAAWETLASYAMPAGAVADSAGNWWRCAADTGQGTGGPGIRAAAFICSNALAIPTWLSFCPQGYSTAYVYQVIEFAGLPASYWPLIDLHVGNAVLSGTTISQNGVTTVADYVIAMAAMSNSGLTLSYSGTATLTAIGQVNQGASNDTIAMNVAYGQYAANTTVTDNSWTASGSARLANLMFGISQASALPVQSRPTYPKITVEAALTATPGDYSQQLTDEQWVPLDRWALGKLGQQAIIASRGQQYELAQPESGQMTVAMDNQAGDFDPQYPGSSLYSNALNSNMSFQNGTSPWTATGGALVDTSTLAAFASGVNAIATRAAYVAPPSGGTPGTPAVFVSGNNGVASTSLVMTVSSAVSIGQQAIIGINSNAANSVSTLVDSKGNTWTAMGSDTSIATRNVFIYKSSITVALTTSDTVTITMANSALLNSIGVKLSNVASSVSVVFNHNAVAAATQSVDAGLTPWLPAQVVAFETNGNQSPTWASPYTLLTTVSGGGSPFFTSGWSTYNSISDMTAATTTPAAQTFAIAAVIVRPLAGATGTGLTSEQVPINPNYPYFPSAWAAMPGVTATSITPTINWFDAAHSPISSSSGAAVPLAAGLSVSPYVTFQQVISATGLVPPSNARFASVTFTGSAANVLFFLAEAGTYLSPGPQTGLIRLSTPVRASCWWNGQKYPIGFGYVERWPQDWPDFPQWGWSAMIATDVVGVAASVNLPSAVQGEIYVDHPYFCFPFNEQYNTADGLTANNTARLNQRTATFSDSDHPLETGQTLGFAGDAGTGIGTTSYNTIITVGTNLNAGPGVTYGPDPGMPQPPLTFDLWVNLVNPGTPPITNSYVKLLDVIAGTNNSPLDANQATSSPPTGSGAPGVIASLFLDFKPSGGPVLKLAANSSVSTETTSSLIPGSMQLYGQNFPILPHLIVVTLDPSSHTVSVTNDNSGASVSCTWTPVEGPIHTIVYGPMASEVGNVYQVWNYALAYASVYPSLLPNYRQIARLYSGWTGFIGDDLMDRALRYVAWAGLNLGLAGQTDPSTFTGQIANADQLGPAFSTANSPLASALNADCLSMGARWAGTANGNLVVLTRAATLNRNPSATFGDAPTGDLNDNPLIRFGTTGWQGNNGATLSTVPSMFSDSGLALVMTPDGVTAQTQLAARQGGTTHIPVTANALHRWAAWVRSDQGWASGVTLAVNWLDGSGTSISTSTGLVLSLPSGALASNPWQPVVLWATAPANAVTGVFFLQAVGTPPASTLFQVCHAPVRLALDQVPYLPSQSLDYDNSYLSNVFQVNAQEGPNVLSSYTVQDPASIQQYFQRGPNTQDINGVSAGAAFDLGNWYLNKYKQPAVRVRQIEVRPHATPFAFDSVLQTDVGDPALTIRDPLNPTTYRLPVTVQRIEHRIGPGYWSTQYQQSPYVPENAILAADDTSGRGVLGQNTLGW